MGAPLRKIFSKQNLKKFSTSRMLYRCEIFYGVYPVCPNWESLRIDRFKIRIRCRRLICRRVKSYTLWACLRRCGSISWWTNFWYETYFVLKARKRAVLYSWKLQYRKSLLYLCFHSLIDSLIYRFFWKEQSHF